MPGGTLAPAPEGSRDGVAPPSMKSKPVLHHILRRAQPGPTISVPAHGSKVIKKGTLRALLRHAGISVDEFRESLE